MSHLNRMIYFSPLKVHSSQAGDESFHEAPMENKNSHARSWPWFGRFHPEMNHFLVEWAQNRPRGNDATSMLPCTVAGMDTLGSGALIHTLDPFPSPIPCL